MMKKARLLLIIFVTSIFMVETVLGSSNWSSIGSNNGTYTSSNRVEKGTVTVDGNIQVYTRRYVNNVLVQDIRTRLTNMYNATTGSFLSKESGKINRSANDVAIDSSGNVYGVDPTTDYAIKYTGGKVLYSYDGSLMSPTVLEGYKVTGFLTDENNFCIGMITTGGTLLDLSGNLMSQSTDNSSNNGGLPPTYGDGPGSRGNNGNSDYGYDRNDYSSEYPKVSTTSVTARNKTYYESSSNYYEYTLSSSGGKLTFSTDGGRTYTIVRSSGVVAYAFTRDGYVNYVYKSGSRYYGVETEVGSSSSGTTVFSGASDYVLKVGSDGFVTRFGKDNDYDDDYYYDDDYPYFTPTGNSATTRTYYKYSSLYYKYLISSNKMKFYKNGSSSATTIDTDDYEGSVVYFSFTEDEEVIFVTKYNGRYYAYTAAIGKSTVNDVIFENSKSYSVTKDSDGFVTKIASASKTYSL